MAERALRHRFEVAGVDAAAGHRVAALTHAGVVAQAAFVQVRVGQGVAAGDPFGLRAQIKGGSRAAFTPQIVPVLGGARA